MQCVQGCWMFRAERACEMAGAQERSDWQELRGCIHLALNSTLRPRVPDHFTHEAYSGRVRAIFKAFL